MTGNELTDKPLTDRELYLKLRDAVIMSKTLRLNKLAEIGALREMFNEAKKKGDRQYGEILRDKAMNAQDLSTEYGGQLLAYEAMERLFAHNRSVLPTSWRWSSG